jgi:NAD(P)-dependent dehydrogenase (short-subunit alcohol dehydrogenase family)
MTKTVFPRFREQKGGHIIQGTSIGGRIGSLGRARCAAAKSRVEGRSESLSKEIGSLGIKVTIIEPGGFRTDFASSSSEFRKSRPEYQSTVGATVGFQPDYNGKQPGDPHEGVEALLHLVSLTEPPLWLLLASDSYVAAEKSALEKLEFGQQWTI